MQWRTWRYLAVAAVLLCIPAVILANPDCGDSIDIPTDVCDGDCDAPEGTCIPIVSGEDPDNPTCGWVYGDPNPCDGDYTIHEFGDCKCMRNTPNNPDDDTVCGGSDGEEYEAYSTEVHVSCEKLYDPEADEYYCDCLEDDDEPEEESVTMCKECPEES